jgi:hypothetical protein
MADKPGDEPKIHIDSDWKEEARKEKERLKEETEEGAEGGPLPDPTFGEVVNMILMQAMIGLGGMRTPDGRTIPPDPEIAKHHIELLAVLQEKTKGNLTDDEQRFLDAAIYEMRMRFVQAMTPQAPGAKAPPA